MIYIICHQISLEKLKNDKSLKQTIRRIKIDLGNKEDFRKLERQINRHYFSCGCKASSFAVLATFSAGYIIWLLGVAPTIWAWWKVLTILFLSALIGKIIGLCISYMKFKRILSELEVYCRGS